MWMCCHLTSVSKIAKSTQREAECTVCTFYFMEMFARLKIDWRTFSRLTALKATTEKGLSLTVFNLYNLAVSLLPN